MTLDKAIEIYEKGTKLTWNGKPTVEAEECQQMAEWLKELQAHREAWEKMETELNAMTNRYYVTRFDYAIEEAIDVVKEYRPKEGDGNASAD